MHINDWEGEMNTKANIEGRMKNISTSAELGQIEVIQGCRDIQSIEKILNNESD